MKSRTLLLILVAVTVVLMVADICVGAVNMPLSEVWAALRGEADDASVLIVRHIRLLKALVAVLVGVALSVSGLQMQTLFRNPLAGPYVLGISSGASLGVALVMLGAPVFGAVSSIGVAMAAWAGSAAMLLLITVAGARIKDIMVILILGIMLSSAISAVVQVLQYISRDDSLKSYVIWTMGTLGDVTSAQFPVFLGGISAGAVMAMFTVKPLNMLLLGENYARSLGLDLKRSRTVIILSTTLLAGTVTAFCGPIGFIGLAIPHVARALFRTADHRILIPASALTGAAVMIVCDITAKLLALPINSITSLVGIPVVVWVVLANK
ncbi:MAG: iron ABC transporter permease [Muribaculaceae bacterium]|nr:iron ABC transporter permease [Muribaculaceae bacterium]